MRLKRVQCVVLALAGMPRLPQCHVLEFWLGIRHADQLQQGHWQKETDILGNITTTRDKPFSFKTIDQVLEENEQMREKIKWLGDIIAENIMSQVNERGHRQLLLADTVGHRVDDKGFYINGDTKC